MNLESKKAKIINAIKSGEKVECYGNPVTAEKIKYGWQTPELWINHKNGSGYKANYTDIKMMEIL